MSEEQNMMANANMNTILSTNMSESAPANSGKRKRGSSASGTPRGKYAKFTSAMDIVLLQVLRENNPYLARHGTRIQVWEMVAQALSTRLTGDPSSFSWYTCRDRIQTLLKSFSHGELSKITKNEADELNIERRKLLADFHKMLTQTSEAKVGARTAASIRAAKNENENGQDDEDAPSDRRENVKRRKKDGEDESQGLSSEEFRKRVLELMEQKQRLDERQRIRDNELRQQELELQERLLAYLQAQDD